MTFKLLVSAVSEQCQEIKQALASIAYFETWESDVIGECCRVSSIAEYPPHKIILGPDTGNSHTVYFILEGTCKMIQHIHVKIESESEEKFFGNSKGTFQYKRYRHSNSKILNSELKNEVYKSRLLNRIDFQASKTSDVGEGLENCQNDGEMKQVKQGMGEVLMKEVEQIETNVVGVTDSSETSHQNGKNETNPCEEHISESPEEQIIEKSEVIFEPDHHLKILEECKKKRNETISVCQKSALPEKLKNVKSVFMQTGFLLKGACFGLDKCDNFIMSMTKVKCLKIPQRFLLKHNPCNIWNRIRLFHALYLPKDERIFNNFRSDRLWTEWKKKLSEEIVSQRNIPNDTLDSDVPYSLRLVDIRFRGPKTGT